MYKARGSVVSADKEDGHRDVSSCDGSHGMEADAGSTHHTDSFGGDNVESDSSFGTGDPGGAADGDAGGGCLWRGVTLEGGDFGGVDTGGGDFGGGFNGGDF